MKKRTVKKIVTEYSDVCGIGACIKKVVGNTANQVRYNMKIHKEAKHKNDNDERKN